MSHPEHSHLHESAGERLKAFGLRSTPQRRAILAAFRGGSAEHLSADEVYARATQTVPDLGRGTVYATLAEFSEVGLLAAFGSPEPVRYEVNVTAHAHFRCRLCLRVYDVEGGAPDPFGFERDGHAVERIDLRADGTCRECLIYDDGIRAGAELIRKVGASERLARHEASAFELDTPIGPLLVAATEVGVARVAFPEHGDIDYLKSLVGVQASDKVMAQLEDARDKLCRYFSGESMTVDCLIDWEMFDEPETLQAVVGIPFGTQRSYHLLGSPLSADQLGTLFGANPLPILTPCHRVTEGAVQPSDFVGGTDRREWLLAHERSHE